eukprot:6385070-Pyramimonas_sp.AAC.1
MTGGLQRQRREVALTTTVATGAGNGDNVLRAKNGAEIDKHDFVFRFNTPLKGAPDHLHQTPSRPPLLDPLQTPSTRDRQARLRLSL